jgi:hypothetical protein
MMPLRHTGESPAYLPAFRINAQGSFVKANLRELACDEGHHKGLPC